MAVYTLDDVLSSTVLLVLVVVLLTFYTWTRRPAGIPPFPATPLPVVGNLLLLGKDPRKLFASWRKKHGDIFSVYIGSKLVIVLNGYDTIRQALMKRGDVFSSRPDIITFTHILRDRGIIATSGPAWKANRKFSHTILRKLGFGSRLIEDKIMKEAKLIMGVMEKSKGQKEDYGALYKFSTSNIMSSVVFGLHFDYDDPRFGECLDALDSMVSALSATGLVNFMPFLQYIPGDLSGLKAIMRSVNCYEEKLVKSEIERHYNEYDGRADDFISIYIKEIKERESMGQDTTQLRNNLTQSVSDLIIGGTETTATMLQWIVLFMLYYQDVQEKCFQEIKENVGLERQPVQSDVSELPYLEATLSEAMRRANIVTFGITHTVTETTKFGGFVFPKGVIIMPNLDSVLMDPDVWPDPEDFRPERFLDKDGKFFKPKEYIPFSIGPRVCIGEALAKMELFLISATLIQRFHFQQPEDEPRPSLDAIIKGSAKPAPYKVKAVPRN